MFVWAIITNLRELEQLLITKNQKQSLQQTPLNQQLLYPVCVQGISEKVKWVYSSHIVFTGFLHLQLGAVIFTVIFKSAWKFLKWWKVETKNALKSNSSAGFKENGHVSSLQCMVSKSKQSLLSRACYATAHIGAFDLVVCVTFFFFGGSWEQYFRGQCQQLLTLLTVKSTPEYTK